MAPASISPLPIGSRHFKICPREQEHRRAISAQPGFVGSVLSLKWVGDNAAIVSMLPLIDTQEINRLKRRIRCCCFSQLGINIDGDFLNALFIISKYLLYLLETYTIEKLPSRPNDVSRGRRLAPYHGRVDKREDAFPKQEVPLCSQQISLIPNGTPPIVLRLRRCYVNHQILFIGIPPYLSST